MPQSELSILAKLAQYLSPPLIVVGLVLTLLFGVYRALIQSGLIAKQDKASSGALLQLLLKHGFLLAVLVTLLGFALLLLQTLLGR